MREYKIHDELTGLDLLVKCKNDKDCLFCTYCSDVLWDYTHGPYLIICKLGEEPFKDNCRYFDDIEVKDNE